MANENKNASPRSTRENVKELYKKETYKDFQGENQLEAVLRVLSYDLRSVDRNGVEHVTKCTEILNEKRTYDKALNDWRGGVYFKKQSFTLSAERLADVAFLKALASVSEKTPAAA